MNNDLTSLKELRSLLLDKYQDILSKEHTEKLSIEEMVDQIATYYENIIACMPGNVYWTDRNSITLGCNDNVVKMLGLASRRDIIGMSYEDIAKLAKKNANEYDSFKQDDQEVINSGKPKINIEEPPITDFQNNLIYFLTTRVPMLDKKNQVVGIVGVSIDITERKKIESQLIQEKARAEAAELKNTFMENMSHDFKTPLNRLYDIAQILKNREDLPEDIKEFINLQDKSIFRLNKLVQSILEFDRIASGKINLQEEELNLLDILESITNNLAYYLKNKKVNLIIHYPPSIPHSLINDSYAVTKILLNLMSNAVKFTEEGEVTVAVNTVSQKNQQILLKITITDTGQGIPSNKLDQIFEKFHCLETANKKSRTGTGIGLSVVKELVEKLNGKIEVTSQVGIGSTFAVTLPFKLQDITLQVLEWQKCYPDVRILLVNDNKTVSDAILERLGESMVKKINSEETINVLQAAAKIKQPYHIVIIDDNINIMDPIELIKIVRHIHGIPAFTPILCTAPQNKIFFDTARQAGYADFIIKPILPTELQTKIYNILEQKYKTLT
jgi:two-component system aerobic respiration control sensor histidine kinase ArcB